jgi:hypothetical protein
MVAAVVCVTGHCSGRGIHHVRALMNFATVKARVDALLAMAMGRPNIDLQTDLYHGTIGVM